MPLSLSFRERITELRIQKNISEYKMSLDLGHSKSYIRENAFVTLFQPANGLQDKLTRLNLPQKGLWRREKAGAVSKPDYNSNITILIGICYTKTRYGMMNETFIQERIPYDKGGVCGCHCYLQPRGTIA